MDQLKEYLNQAVKYRFWIAIGFACLLPLIAYFVASGSLAAEEKKETDNIERSNKEVQNYVRGQIYNSTWKKVVDEKTQVVSKDVDASWKKLYDVQAPLLTWPEEVKETIPAWGPKEWPKGVDSAKVNLVVNDYLQVYPAYVDKVYESFSPFDPETGKGIVASPPKELLLKPAVFDETNPPSLGKVWNAQRKLWVERTMLDIVAKVNAKAKATTWDQAPIKQILDLEVASAQAQDQMSVAKGEALKEMPDILDPKAKVAEKAAGAGGATTSAAPSSAGFARGGPSAASTSNFEYISSASDNQFITVPVAMKVYIDQERIPDLLVEFRNSPMDIKVKDFDLRPPTTPVQKPVKGSSQSSYAGLMGFSGGRGRGDEGVMGGSAAFASRGNAFGKMKGYQGPGGGGSSNFFNKGGSSEFAGAGNANASKGGINKAQDVLKAAQEKRRKEKKKPGEDKDEDKEKEKEEEASTSNPYFNVVEVTIKGQARFYAAPPPAPTASSPGATPPPEAPKPEAPKAEPAKAEPAKAPETPKDAAKSEPAKADTSKDAAKSEPSKADTSKDAAKTEPSKDAAKTEPAKDVPKPEAPKGQPAAKPDAPKPADSKGEAPKAEPGKGDAPASNPDKSNDVPAPPKR